MKLRNDPDLVRSMVESYERLCEVAATLTPEHGTVAELVSIANVQQSCQRLRDAARARLDEIYRKQHAQARNAQVDA